MAAASSEARPPEDGRRRLVRHNRRRNVVCVDFLGELVGEDLQVGDVDLAEGEAAPLLGLVYRYVKCVRGPHGCR